VSPARPRPGPLPGAALCRWRRPSPSAHLFRVTLTVAQPAAQQQVSLPVWIPGSYMLREFSKNLQKLSARQDGRAAAVTQLDKARWQVECVPSSPLVLSYEVYAFDNSVRTAWLDAQRGFFNCTSLCLKVHGQEAVPHLLEVIAGDDTASWRVASRA
jgi:predicted metalloprotease with PDZ domain